MPDIEERRDRLITLLEEDDALMESCMKQVMTVLCLPEYEDPEQYTEQDNKNIQNLFMEVLQGLAELEESRSFPLSPEELKQEFMHRAKKPQGATEN